MCEHFRILWLAVFKWKQFFVCDIFNGFLSANSVALFSCSSSSTQQSAKEAEKEKQKCVSMMPK